MLATAAFWRATREGGPTPTTRAVAFQVPETFGDNVVVDERFVEAAHAEGVAVHVWTIEDEESVRRLVDLGVDGIITDLPTMLSRVLDELGVAWKGRA